MLSGEAFTLAYCLVYTFAMQYHIYMYSVYVAFEIAGSITEGNAHFVCTSAVNWFEMSESSEVC